MAKEAKKKERVELKKQNMQKKAPQFEINKRHRKYQAKQNSHTLVRNDSWESSKDQDQMEKTVDAQQCLQNIAYFENKMMNLSKKAKIEEFDAPDPILPTSIENFQILKELQGQKLFAPSVTPSKNTVGSNDLSK